MPPRGRGKRQSHVPVHPRGTGRGRYVARGQNVTNSNITGNESAATDPQSDTSVDRGSRRGQSREGNAAHFRPPGLRGREIGMWHASQNVAQKDPKYYLALNIGVDQETQLVTSINDIRDELRRLDMKNEPPTSVAGLSSNSFDQGPRGLSTAYRPAIAPTTSAAGLIEAFPRNTVFPSSSSSSNVNSRTPGDTDFGDEEELAENGAMDAAAMLGAAGNSTSDAAFRVLLNNTSLPATAGDRADTATLFAETFDSELRTEYARRMQSPSSKLKQMLQYRRTLPVFEQRQHILALVKNNPVIVVSGETGCGKTTQVPQFLLDDFLSQAASPTTTPFRIMVTQPRRISAISTSERVADERDEHVGKSVGFIVRLEHVLPRTHASITYCTTGILLQWLKSDPKLTGISHVILDEIHEQDISSDFLMIILKRLLAGERCNNLKLILMSATLNSEKFSTYFNDAPLVHVPGFTYPVKQHFVEDVLKIFIDSRSDGRINAVENGMNLVRVPAFKRKYARGSHGDSNRDEEQQFENYVKQVVRPKHGTRIAGMMDRLRQNEGKVNMALIDELVAHLMTTTPHSESILIFVPGWKEIQELHKNFTQKYGRSHVIIPLHSMLPTSQQRSVFVRPPYGQRKLVIASNIAETSITIDDIVHVIDSGLQRLSDFDPETNVQLLDTMFETKANLMQRKGRAGRVKAGCSYHLVSRHRYESMQDYQKPELLRSRLENVCLQVKILGYENVPDFLAQAIQPPPVAYVTSALQMLKNINALDSGTEALTDLGRKLASLPLDPLLGRTLLYAAVFSCLLPVANIIAALSFKDPFVVPFNSETFAQQKKEEFARETASDHLACHYALKAYEDVKRSADLHNDRRELYDWCWENYLSHETCRLLIGMRNQFGSYLRALDFISNGNISDSRFNRNADNDMLIVSIIALGLYPNWGCVPHSFGAARLKKHPTELFALEVGFLASAKGAKKKVKVHRNSVINRLHYVDRGYMAYSFARRLDNTYFIYDASFITSPMLMALACKALVPKREKNLYTLVVDDWVHLRSNERSYACMQNARKAFNALLLRAYESPGTYMPRLRDAQSVECKFLAGLWRAVADELDLSGGESLAAASNAAEE